VIYTRWRIDTIDSPDDEHWVARNMYRSETNTLKKCVKLVINTISYLICQKSTMKTLMSVLRLIGVSVPCSELNESVQTDLVCTSGDTV